MRDKLRDALIDALTEIDQPGTFCAVGSAPAVLPGLEVEGLGPVGLPLTAQQAKELKKFCHQAPYGKGTKTLVDTSVRRVWRVEPGRYALTNPDWDRFLRDVVADVQDELGLEEQTLKSHLYDVLLYEPGSFFLPHRDGEKRDRMVATLVVVLPSSHEGGELVIRHDGEERTIDFTGTDDGRLLIHYAAFYADCEHEVRPLRNGYRLCLVYNLTLAKSKKTVRAPSHSKHVQKVARLLREWAAAESARKLVVTLDHQYTQDGLSWDTLKGVDRAKAWVLHEAARQAGCHAYVGLLTFWESGIGEEHDSEYDYRSGRRRRWFEDDEDDEDDTSQFEMVEVIETKLTAGHWSDPDGHGLPVGELSVDEGELLEPEVVTEVDPDEQYEGYTGNEGMTLERWYRHAAVFLWPERRHSQILCDRNGRNVVPLLNQMVARWRKVTTKSASPLKAQCLDLASALLATWSDERGSYRRPEDLQTAGLLESLDALDEPSLIRRYLGDVLVRDASAEPGEAVAAVCQKRGWETIQAELDAVMKGTTLDSLARNVRLLEQICLARPRKKEGWGPLCAALTNELVTVVEAIDRQPSGYEWRLKQVDWTEILARLARSMIATGQSEGLSRFTAHALATPKTYPVETVQVPALLSLRPWLKKNLKGPFSALTQWVASCRKRLEALTAETPQEPTDFRRSAAIGCSCEHCAELKAFLADPKEREHRFRLRKDLRDHLGHRIRERKADLDLKTDRKGSPQTLVCTKNTASYQASLKKYHEDLERLTAVRSLEAGLPG